MSHTSPASLLIWAILSCMLFTFLVYHLWSFDRFKCLKWSNNGAHSGAFKRIMTYSYLLSVPLIMIYAVGFATIKYQEGFIAHPQLGIIPKPFTTWKQSSQDAILPLTLMFSLAWALELVTHLEELCFWYFLVNAGSNSQDWFRSRYFRVWVAGSCIALLYMPLLTIFTRSDHLKNEAYTFLAGSLGSLSLTIAFLPILYTFPSFLLNLKNEGVDSSTIVRLTKFHELNSIRIVFRFLFTVPFVILGVDGCRPHQHVNESMLWTDLLTAIAGFGCVVSSGITLTIFFPRSVEGEIASKEARKTRSTIRSHTWSDTDSMTRNRDSAYSGQYLVNNRPTTPTQKHPLDYDDASFTTPISAGKSFPPMMEMTSEESYSNSPRFSRQPIRPNRRVGEDVELGGIGGEQIDFEMPPTRSRATLTSVNPAVHQFRSPIDFASYRTPIPASNHSRLTFTRP
ncbi:hypothetical protein AAF712_007468 [Marasmius tenuissimus]|uniref:Uncharacterized protein n=1 Tax=Marasmius tenuissimus TaxID=585030 RepID=A0ABR2ZWY4_9AGAR